MQKLDFTTNIRHVITELSSEKFVEIFENGFINPAQPFNFATLIPILFASKSKYDDLLKSDVFSNILNKINASEVYDEQNLATLSTLLKHALGRDLITNPKVLRLFSFHKSLVDLKNISNELLIDKRLTGDLDLLMDSGYLIFQIAIKEEGLEPSQYLKIISALDELIKVIEKIKSPKNEEDSSTRIILLDSGSDTNLGIKSSIETTKSLFLIFKEVWDFISNYRFYKTKQKNEAFMDSLTIRKEILKMKEYKVLTDKEAQEYTHLIKTRTDSLIGLKVLPKSLMNIDHNIANKKLLDEYKSMKLLE